MGSLACRRDPCPLLFQVGIVEAGTSNQIKTTRYNLLTFLPLATLVQFKRLANVYFLINTILQFIPQISPLSPFASLAPLIFVLSVSLLRSASQEISKYKYDQSTNSTRYEAYRDPLYEEHPLAYNWATKRSDELQVGEIIKINKDETLPADLVLLATSNEDGRAFIQTSSLDGEKNFKVRNALTITQSLYAATGTSISPSAVSQIELISKPFVDIEKPHEQLYSFNGRIQLEYQKKLSEHKHREFVKINQFLYRNCLLRNTKYIIGVVTYVGQFTKTMLNGGKTTQKMSRLQKQVNYYMIFIFLLQLTLIMLCGVLRIFLYYGTQRGVFITTRIEFLEIRSYVIQGAITSITYFILLNPMIPISLLVSIEIVKFGQGLFVSFDTFLSSVKRPSKVFNSSINEQLGMIEYIFTDKTGTLTCNEMILKQLVIANQCYGSSEECLSANHKKMFFNPQLAANFSDELNYLKSLPDQDPEQPKLTAFGQEKLREQTQTVMNSLMLLTMAVCHECSRDPDSSYGFQGPSPDEIALVTSAADLGVTFEKNGLGTVQLNIARFTDSGESMMQMQANPRNKSASNATISICEVFEFDSDRKRMSVILNIGTDMASPRYLLLCKGADSVIEKRLSSCYKRNPERQKRLNYIQQCVKQFSVEGLRTLMFSYRVLTDGQYRSFKSKYSLLTESQQKEKWEMVSELETGLLLIGASGVQDKLQGAVSETISDFIRAEIKVCMLTGDKMETAENIAKSCGLFKQQFHIYKIGEESPLQKLSEAYHQVNSISETNTYDEFAIIVQGEALNSVIESPDFLFLFEHCSASVFCRITPKNKAQIITIGKCTLNKVTLAIGDGANDVPMIMAANVGIGLYGNQGMNAVQASDYAISQFKFLWRLLFVHGRWNYLRIAELIKYFFYKNIVFSLCQLWFGYFCSFSGQSIYDATYLVLYNTIFTGGPIVVRSLLEQDINYMELMNNPSESSEQLGSLHRPMASSKDPDPYHPKQDQSEQTSSSAQFINRIKINPELQYLFPLLYRHSQQQLSLTAWTVFLLVLESVVESLAVFLITKFCIQLPELWAFSVCLYSVVFALVTLRICYDISYWTTLLVLSFVLTSILPLILFAYVISVIDIKLAGIFTQLVSLPDFYLVLILGVGIGAMIQIFFSIIGKYYFPTVVDFVRKQAKNMIHARRESRKQKHNKGRNLWASDIRNLKPESIQLAQFGLKNPGSKPEQ